MICATHGRNQCHVSISNSVRPPVVYGGSRVFASALQHVSEREHSLEGILAHFVDGMVELHSINPRLQHVLLEEVAHPPEIREALHREKSMAIQSVRALLETRPEVGVRDLPSLSYMLVNTVECLTHQVTADADAGMGPDLFKKELVLMLHSYLTLAERVP